MTSSKSPEGILAISLLMIPMRLQAVLNVKREGVSLALGLKETLSKEPVLDNNA